MAVGRAHGGLNPHTSSARGCRPAAIYPGGHKKKRALRIRYQSMNATRPEPTWRWISPHAFGNDGLRWHVRAYCHLGGTFKDFILSRCLDAKDDAEAGASCDQDIHWKEVFAVVLIPNPKLSDEQQKVIAVAAVHNGLDELPSLTPFGVRGWRPIVANPGRTPGYAAHG